MKTLSEQLKQYRKENNLTQIQLANLVGVSYKSISSWECNIKKPNALNHAILQRFGFINCDKRSDTQKIKQQANRNYVQKKSSRRKRLYVDVIQNISTLQNFGKRLKQLRQEQGLTLQAFADKYDLSTTHLFNLEAGHAITLRITTMQLLLQDGVDLQKLLVG